MGEIPPYFGNFSSLKRLYTPENNLKGKIPNSFGSLQKLVTLSVYDNYLSSTIPMSIFNLSSLKNIDVKGNQLQGYIPPNLASTLPNLEFFQIGENLLIGRLPTSMSNATNLLFFDVRYNGFTGGAPSFSGLKSLEFLGFLGNPLGSGKPNDLDFLPSFLNSTATLQYLLLGDCNFGGVLPRFIANFSELRDFRINYNFISGYLPSDIHLLANLECLDLAENQLTGTIPSSWGSLQQLIILNLGGNQLFGDIPFSLGNLSFLSHLFLYSSDLQGTLPSTLGALSSLSELNISGNLIHGFIPDSFSSLKSLETLDLSSNNLTGKIPEFLGKLQYLRQLNLSSNHLEGEIPTEGIFKNKTKVELDGNSHLCGGIPQFRLPKCKTEGASHIQMWPIFVSTAIFILAIVGLIVCIYKGKNRRSSTLNAAIELIPKLSYWKYGMGSALSSFGDTYSYGIILLEIFTGRSPTSDIFNNGLTLHNYVKMAIPEQVISIMDPKLLHKEVDEPPRNLVRRGRFLECLVSIFKIGIACSVELPRERMNIGCAIKELHSVKNTLIELGDFEIIPCTLKMSLDSICEDFKATELNFVALEIWSRTLLFSPRCRRTKINRRTGKLMCKETVGEAVGRTEIAQRTFCEGIDDW
nr:probable LRR receptor-like serine/threonine-protein kinase At3g47570 [Ipomoea batatas]